MTPSEIVNEMMCKDAFSKWLHISIIEVQKGYCQLSLCVTEEMVNGFHIAHGGIAYSLADSALAFASNAHGKQCVSTETSISHIRSTKVGDTLTATCTEINRGKRLGIYQVLITNQEEKTVAHFKGSVMILDTDWG